MTPRRARVGASGFRLGVLKTALTLIGLLLIYQLFSLQVMQHGHYSALAAVQHDVSSVLSAERGRILVQDKPGQYFPVAINRKVEKLIISPRDINGNAEAVALLAHAVNLEPAVIQSAIDQYPTRRYWLIKSDLSDEEAKAVASLRSEGKIPRLGAWLESETRRFYPEGEFLSNVLGFIPFLADEKKGLYGVERSFEETLAGIHGHLEGVTDAGGTLIAGASRRLIPAVNGGTVVLTIDRAIQLEAERALASAVSRFGADSGSVIVADPKTGAILAMAVVPKFNPNEYNKVRDVSVFVNPTIQARYEPGSIIKPLTMAAALESGKVKPDDIYIDTGSVVVGSHTIKNSDGKSNGRQNMSQVLELSLNTGMVHVQQKMGGNVLTEFFKKFGLEEKTNISLPGEILGDLRNLNTKSDIAYATASFGQGISSTPLQVVQAYLALANGGEMKQAHIISEIQKSDGSREVVKPQTVRRVVSAKTAAEVSSMLVNVVENGHGKRAAVPGYYIAGKTGTAQVPLTDRRGYDPDKTIGSFVGYGPVENPAFVALVKIDNPKGVRFAESTAAPVFGEIAKFILDYLQVPPTRSAN